MKDIDKFKKNTWQSDAEEWDTQIENDANIGRLDILASEALNEYEVGNTKEI